MSELLYGFLAICMIMAAFMLGALSQARSRRRQYDARRAGRFEALRWQRRTGR